MSLLAGFAVLAVAQAAVFSENDVERRMELVDFINSNPTATWTAKVHERFAGKPFSYTADLCGVLEGGPALPEKVINTVGDIPDSFCSIEQWGDQCPSLKVIRDQSACGSCWAIAAAESATDRYCIETGDNPTLSTDDLLSCCGFSCGNGCNGGYPSAAWNWFTKKGISTGGMYGDFSLCKAYPFPMCEHHTTGPYPDCPKALYPTPKCVHSCDANSTYTTKYDDDKHVFASAYSVPATVSAIQTEIMTNGPVEGAFSVYEDFETYSGGVYQHTTGSYLGGHAIKIIGWGVDSTENGSTPYWTVVNSWNDSWGENGKFRILRGSNECGIEGSIVAGLFKK